MDKNIHISLFDIYRKFICLVNRIKKCIKKISDETNIQLNIQKKLNENLNHEIPSKMNHLLQMLSNHKKEMIDFCVVGLGNIINNVSLIRKLDSSKLIYLQKKVKKCLLMIRNLESIK